MLLAHCSSNWCNLALRTRTASRWFLFLLAYMRLEVKMQATISSLINYEISILVILL